MAKKFWNVKNEDEKAELILYGEISSESWYGDEITPKQFAEDLKSLNNKDLTVRLNSPGGDVFAAHAIYNLLKAYKGNVDVVIDGLAASAATIIMCAGRVTAPNNSLLMIHNPSTGLIGYFEESDLKKVADSLKAVKQTIINVYLSKTSGILSETKLKHMMDDETYMTAQEAKDFGFVDEVAGVDANIENKNGTIFINSVEINKKFLQKPDKFADFINKKKVNKVENNFDFNAMSDEELGKAARILLNSGDKTLETAAELTPEQLKDFQEPSPIHAMPKNNLQDAVLAERERMLKLDAMKVGNQIIDAYIDTAKQDGISVENAQKYVDKMKVYCEKTDTPAQPSTNVNFAEALKVIHDQLTSGADSVQATNPRMTPEQKNFEERKARANLIAKFANEGRVQDVK